MMSETPEQRSRIMRAVKGRDTMPEMIVRRLVHGMGFRFRLHRKDLPGTPDLVFPRLRKVIFVHGCFWHGHDCSRGARVPMKNREYWVAKIDGNQKRDNASIDQLLNLGWEVDVVWECETRDDSSLIGKLRRYLEMPRSN